MIHNELKKLASENKLVSIEREDVDDGQITGVIIDTNDDYLMMRLHDDDGSVEGFTIFPVEQISEIVWGNREHDCIEEFMKNKSIPETPDIKLNGLSDILQQLSKKYDAVCLMENGNESSFDVASIIEVDDDWVKADCYGTTKTLSRMNKLISTKTFSRIEFDTQYVSRVVELHNRQS